MDLLIFLFYEVRKYWTISKWNSHESRETAGCLTDAAMKIEGFQHYLSSKFNVYSKLIYCENKLIHDTVKERKRDSNIFKFKVYLKKNTLNIILPDTLDW